MEPKSNAYNLNSKVAYGRMWKKMFRSMKPDTGNYNSWMVSDSETGGDGRQRPTRPIKASISQVPAFPRAILNLHFWDKNQMSATTLIHRRF